MKHSAVSPSRTSCDSCEIAYINGVRCHEHGCPDAWKDYPKVCFECGCNFVPETRYQRTCTSCLEELQESGR